ncbi:hypothetical protein [Martelella sp. AMO21009]
MGRMKDLQIEQRNLEVEWLGIISKLFYEKGYKIVAENDGFVPTYRPDLIIERGGGKIIVELKLYRSERVSLALMRNAFISLSRSMEIEQANSGILIIPQDISPDRLSKIPPKEGIEIWDKEKLIEEMRPFPHLAQGLAYFFRELRVGAERPPEGPDNVSMLGEVEATLPEVGAGELLAQKISKIPPGKEGGAALNFEEVCKEALILLFGKDLLGWQAQSKVEMGFQRMDFIARLQPVQSSFWSTLATDFRTRYVVFEFKNYGSPIGQDQIYTTEKYLFTRALRSVAIVISKNGMSESADRAAQGALREQGKLILCISGEEFQAMLRGFDQGNEPDEILIRKRDELLMGIGR